MPPIKPLYVQSHLRSELIAKADQAAAILKECTLCPRHCRVDRMAGESGFCRTSHKAVVASYNPHFGEESPLVGRKGSGTIFFSHCNLMCNFCQNYDISHHGEGFEVNESQLAQMMLALQKAGCHNINLVTPTHVVPQILGALAVAVEKGLNIPLVYNSSGYDSVSTLAILDQIIDIYMPDFKFWESDIADKTCQAPDYPQVARKALMEMHRQVGDLAIDAHGLAYRGLLVRHLVMPDGCAGTASVMEFIASQLSVDTYVNIMPQYQPYGDASREPTLCRSITREEFKIALKQAREAGITRFDRQRHFFTLR